MSTNNVITLSAAAKQAAMETEAKVKELSKRQKEIQAIIEPLEKESDDIDEQVEDLSQAQFVIIDAEHPELKDQQYVISDDCTTATIEDPTAAPGKGAVIELSEAGKAVVEKHKAEFEKALEPANVFKEEFEAKAKAFQDAQSKARLARAEFELVRVKVDEAKAPSKVISDKMWVELEEVQPELKAYDHKTMDETLSKVTCLQVE